MDNIAKAKQLHNQGQSVRKIAAELGVSKSTVSNYLKKSVPDKPVKFEMTESSALDPLNNIHLLPPGRPGHPWMVPAYMQHSGIFRAGKDFYVPWDQAVQQSWPNTRAMYNNLIIREPLQARLWAAAEQEWHIEPKDKKDPQQIEVAKCIQDTIENIPDLLKLKYSLLKSRWFGVYGAQLNYQWTGQKKLCVKEWSEIHGDSLVFKMNSDEVGVYVIATNGLDNQQITTEAGYIGRAHVFEGDPTLKFDDQNRPYKPLGFKERQSVIIMSYDPQASDFLDPRSAGGIKGLGLRSTIYPVWLQMASITGWMVDWLQRVGGGVTLYKFLRGNEESYLAAQQLAESQSNSASVMVPVDIDQNNGQRVEGIERIEVPATGLDNMLKVIQEFFGSQIRRFIVGQDATSQPMNAGLGSNISDVQEKTFFRIVHFDCIDLEQTLTRELVQVIQEWNHPGTPPCKFVSDHIKPNPKEQLESIKIAWEMGVSFIEDDVRSLCGAAKPTLDDKVIQNSKGQQLDVPGLSPQPVDDSGIGEVLAKNQAGGE